MLATAALTAALLPFVAPGAAEPAAATTASPPPPYGYWLAASDGGVFTFGAVPYAGSTGGQRLNQPIVGMAGTPSGRGYWLVARDGGIFAFGDAGYYGSTGNIHLNQPIVGMARTPSGGGYWLVARDGGIFAFGDAGYYGSTGDIRLNQPVVGMASTASGNGYWLVASDGGVFAFGDAGYHGSTGDIRLNQPIVGMAATPDGLGYWMTASDGGIFAFGDAGYHGSTGDIRLNRPIVAMAANGTGGGYWLVATDGGIFAFGDAPFRGSTGNIRLNQPIVAMAAAPSTDPYPPGATGYDISWPQCGGAYPSPGAFAIIGVNGGKPFEANPCFGSEAAWAGASPSVYLNTSMPTDGRGDTGPAGTCTAGDNLCRSYNWGWNAVDYAVGRVDAAGVVPAMWWLDVETKNSWQDATGRYDTAANSRVVIGMVDNLNSRGLLAGVYSTGYQWGLITGGLTLGLPIWVAGSTPTNPAAGCDPAKWFAGGTAWLTQHVETFDTDYACPVT
ncbi:MAG TPA: hypothetical protein VHN98_08295 [Acidimicrobiales bacterium]|nr:hypothetical protein [Acidimicrobiales bacterium]